MKVMLAGLLAAVACPPAAATPSAPLDVAVGADGKVQWPEWRVARIDPRTRLIRTILRGR